MSIRRTWAKIDKLLTDDQKQTLRQPQAFAFGPGGPPGAGTGEPLRLGDILPSFVQKMLELTPEQQTQLGDLQQGIDQKIETLLADDQRQQLKEMREGFARGGPFGLGPPGFGPPGFGPPGFGPPPGPRDRGGPGDFPGPDGPPGPPPGFFGPPDAPDGPAGGFAGPGPGPRDGAGPARWSPRIWPARFWAARWTARRAARWAARTVPQLSLRHGLSWPGRQRSDTRSDAGRTGVPTVNGQSMGGSTKSVTVKIGGLRCWARPANGPTGVLSSMKRTLQLVLLALMWVVLVPSSADAYIGPGAGFALAGSFLAVFAAVFSAIMMLLAWPFRLLLRIFFRRRPPARSRVRRVVILGLDGLDYGLTQTLLDAGKLPHLAALRDQGCFKPLGSTLPPISPVAWSSFQTGVNPGKHNIFDFLMPDPAHVSAEAEFGRDQAGPARVAAWGSTACRWAKPTSACCVRAGRSGAS